MASTKAAATIVVWIMLFVVSLIAAMFSTFFAGVVVGSLVTAMILGLTVKWSIEALVAEMMGNVEDINEAMMAQQPLHNIDDEQ